MPTWWKTNTRGFCTNRFAKWSLVSLLSAVVLSIGACGRGRQQQRWRIRRLRFDHGETTQDELGNRAGVTRYTIMALESGKYFPPLLLAFRIARAFEVGVDQVFEYVETNGRANFGRR